MLHPKTNHQKELPNLNTHTHTQTHIDIRTYMHNILCIIFLPSPQYGPPTNLPIDIICPLELLTFQNGNSKKNNTFNLHELRKSARLPLQTPTQIYWLVLFMKIFTNLCVPHPRPPKIRIINYSKKKSKFVFFQIPYILFCHYASCELSYNQKISHRHGSLITRRLGVI